MGPVSIIHTVIYTVKVQSLNITQERHITLNMQNHRSEAKIETKVGTKIEESSKSNTKLRQNITIRTYIHDTRLSTERQAYGKKNNIQN